MKVRTLPLPRGRAASLADPWGVLGATALGMFVVSLDTTVNVALPAMTDALAAPIATLQWIIIAYVLTSTSLVLGFGRLADMFGRRWVWSWGLLALAVALAACGLAQNLGQLVAARAFQAVGAAMVYAGGPALVTAAFPSGQRGKALGLLAMGASAGAAAGPLLGGWLVSTFGWQAVFLGRVPFALAAGGLSFAVLVRDDVRRARERFDGLGAALLGAAVAALLLALNRGPAWGWADRRIVGALAVALVLAAAFVARERSFTPPVVDLALFRNRHFTAANAAGFLSSLAMFGVWLLLPYYLVDGRGRTALQAGWFLACVPATTALVAPLSGWLSDRAGPRRPALAGLMLEAIALLWLARLGSDSAAVAVIAGLVLLGVGLGTFQAPNQSAVMGSVPPSALGVAGGMLSMMRTLGIVSGVAILGAVYEAGRGTDGGTAFSLPAFDRAFLVAAGVAGIAALVHLLASMKSGDRA